MDLVGEKSASSRSFHAFRVVCHVRQRRTPSSSFLLHNEVDDIEGERAKSELAVYTLNLSRCHMLDAREFFHSYVYIFLIREFRLSHFILLFIES